MAEALVKTRLVSYLEAHPEGVDAGELAREALGFRGAHGAIAEKVVSAAIDYDARFLRLSSGNWVLQAKGNGVRLDAATFLCLGCVRSQEGGDDVALASRRVQATSDRGHFPEAVIGINPESHRALGEFASFAEGAIPVAFRLPRYQTTLNRLGRQILGRPLIQNGICLFRL
ncbi:MAG: hypothetical protein O3B73_07735, partial [bacterium]|nr:hypothetical protein [bacterium]